MRYSSLIVIIIAISIVYLSLDKKTEVDKVVFTQAQSKKTSVDKLSKNGKVSPASNSKLEVRIQELSSTVKSRIGFKSEYPLSKPILRSGKFSSQAFFKQTYDGYQIEPRGNVSLSLDQKGKLIGLESDYVSNISIQNYERLSRKDALSYANALKKNDNSILTRGGRKIVWLQGNNGYFAYEFFVSGKKVIVDADNGNILFQKDMRRF